MLTTRTLLQYRVFHEILVTYHHRGTDARRFFLLGPRAAKTAELEDTLQQQQQEQNVKVESMSKMRSQVSKIGV